MRKLFIILFFPVLLIGCKQQSAEVQITNLEIQERLKMEQFRHQAKVHQMTLENEKEMARERGLHVQEMERKSNKFWEFIATAFSIVVSIFSLVGAIVYGYRQLLIKQMRDREIVQEKKAEIEKYKIVFEQLQIMLPQLSKSERKLLFESGGLLSQGKRLEFEAS